MRNKIIDNVSELMELNEDELTEVLLQDKYNKAMLRELVRRSLRVASDYKKAFEYEKSIRKEKDDKLNNLRENIEKLFAE